MGNKYERVVRNVGRPSKFTPERCASILDDIANRIPYSLAAEANGIVEETLYDWLKHGQTDEAAGIDSDYSKFSKAIKRTEITKIKEHQTKIAKNIKNWQADAWLLERRWYKYFGSNVHLNDLEARIKNIEKEETDANKLHSSEVEEDGKEESGL